jgi:hypothetical protein
VTQIMTQILQRIVVLAGPACPLAAAAAAAATAVESSEPIIPIARSWEIPTTWPAPVPLAWSRTRGWAWAWTEPAVTLAETEEF